MNGTNRPSSGFADVHGARLYYEVAGSGAALVMVHAGIADHRMWNDQWPIFAERYTVVRYDMRGFGKSAMVDGPYSHRDDLYGLLRCLGIECAYLMGCSRGGATIVDLTLEHPEMAQGLILVGAGLSGNPAAGEPPRQWEEVVSSFEQGELERTAELEVQIWVDGPQRTPDQVTPQVRDLVREMNLIALKNDSLKLGSEQQPERPAIERLDEIRVPTLVIVGDQDQPYVVETAELLERRITGARRVVMRDTAHVPNMEQPDQFNQIVLDFLSAL
ncbi:MAG TPA: alpha/beta hydrolase [Herpetosiphonaceae bacterium]